jgi:hypothetical protein
VESPLLTKPGILPDCLPQKVVFYLHRGREYVQFSLHENEVKILDSLDKYLRKHFRVATRVCRDAKSKGITVRTQRSEELVSFLLAAVGEYSHTKHLDCAHVGNKLFHAGVAHGYVDGDGCVRYNEHGTPAAFRTKSVSRQLATSFLLAFGI